MAVQEKILTAVPAWAGTAKKGDADVALQGAVGILAIGKPGDISSRAFGPVVTSDIVATDAGEKFGTYVSKKGILVNSNDVANLKNYDENFVAAKGQTVGYLTFGTCIVFADDLENIAADMNVRIIYGKKDAYADGDLVDVEITGFKAGVISL